ncbi:SAM-dependent methyltransferase [Arthrobacter sp. V4I6]|uniref:class I SAM-dependent methyltransferase n=1 Tax=unclassified Arthrobacter TaxID=235627 RepID=UPI00277EE0C3|nr:MULTISPECIES: class I SAM-dependent methyltransferase [unclassified Arthrobacter]MDQ0820655.1 SAM-dependent methyltransferase [Arthrobacter sp. V1I7]MDQ0854914.1 SAM-dependent methyltransferase [Arthrobacter sp. V4I6]
MTYIQHDHHNGHHALKNDHDNEAGLADILDLDAEVLGGYLDEVTEWVAQHTRDAPRTVVDVGAGTGTGSLALARRFSEAELVAIDKSALMLERLQAAAGRGQGLTDRLRAVQADLDVAWPQVGASDLAWAASSLHHLADPDRVLRDLHTALNPGGLLVVIEMDSLPRLLPDEIGLGRPGLEARCHEAMDQAGWNPHPDWRPHLERAGFEIAEQRSFSIEANPAPPSTGRYAHAVVRSIRGAVDGRLATDDLATLDRLLTADDPDGLLRRTDLTVRGSRTAWAARRP